MRQQKGISGQSKASEGTKHLQQKIMRLRQDGLSFEKIAVELGDYSVAYIYKMYRRALKEIIYEDVEQYRKIELSRLDRMYQELSTILGTDHPLVNSGQVVHDFVEDEFGNKVLDAATGAPVLQRIIDLDVKLKTIGQQLKVMERRARLLGLDAPSKTAFTDPDGKKEATFVQFYLPDNGRDSQVPQE